MSEQILVYDLKNHEVAFGFRPTGLTGFISWERLSTIFEEVGETKPNEEVIYFSVTDRGLSFTLEQK